MRFAAKLLAVLPLGLGEALVDHLRWRWKLRCVRRGDPGPGRPFWVPGPEFLAQMVHLLASHDFVGWSHILYPRRVLLLWCAWALFWAGKEFCVDLKVERDSVWGSAVDYFFYAVGQWGAVLTLFYPLPGLALYLGAMLWWFLRDLYYNADWTKVLGPPDVYGG